MRRMASLNKTCLLLCLIAVTLPIGAQTSGKLLRTTSSAISSGHDKHGNPVIITTNRRFSHTQVLPNHVLEDSKNVWMILLEEFRSEWSPGIEGKRATVRVDGWA